MDKIDFSGKTVALFALGDQVGYTYNFVSAMKVLYDKVKERGGRIVGDHVSREGFDFEHSEALVGNEFVGLVTDEVNEPDLTASRIETWVAQVRQALAQPVA